MCGCAVFMVLARRAWRSWAPWRHPNQTLPGIEEAVPELRRRTWGGAPRKLKWRLERDWPARDWPATSTIGEIIKARRTGIPAQVAAQDRALQPVAGPCCGIQPRLLRRFQGLVQERGRIAQFAGPDGADSGEEDRGKGEEAAGRARQAERAHHGGGGAGDSARCVQEKETPQPGLGSEIMALFSGQGIGLEEGEEIPQIRGMRPEIPNFEE